MPFNKQLDNDYNKFYTNFAAVFLRDDWMFYIKYADKPLLENLWPSVLPHLGGWSFIKMLSSIYPQQSPYKSS